MINGGILTGDMIRRELGDGLVIRPFNSDHLTSNSYDLTLADRLWTLADDVSQIDIIAPPVNWVEIELPQSGIWLKPHTIYIGKTMEYTESRKYIPRVSGKSTYARMGLSVCLDALAGDIGYKGHWTLEIVNHTNMPIRIVPFIKICRIEFYVPHGCPDTTYKSQYMYTSKDER